MSNKLGCDLRSFLQKKFGNELIIVDFSIEDLLPLGENFASTMLKISTRARKTKDSPIEEFSFVAKTNSASKSDWSIVFKKEVFMYNIVIPLYERIELESGVDERETIAHNVPVLFGYRLSSDPNLNGTDNDAVILLDNLKVQGYYVLDKKFGLDIQHAKKALQTLAKFHALGMVAKRKFPTEFETFKAQASIPAFDYQLYETINTNIVKIMKRDPRFDKYIERIEKIAERRKGGFKFELVRHDLWSTIIHSDFWTNNIMFHCDKTGKIDDLKMIDFQTYCFADIFVDLSYFICTSINDEVMAKYVDKLLDIYYETLISILNRSHVDVCLFTKEKFYDQLKKKAWFVFLYCAGALNFLTADMNDYKGLDQGSLFSSLMSCEGNDLFHKKILQLVKFYDDRHWLQ